MSSQKDKGRRLENYVVEQLNQAGIPAERIPLSGSLGGKYKDDVIVGDLENPTARIECKNRESIADYMWEYLDPVDYLVLKKNNKKPLVVMRLDQLIELLQVKLNTQPHKGD